MATVHGGVAYLTGQVPSADVLDGDVAAQTASVLRQVDALLASCGSHKSHILSATVYLQGNAGTAFSEMNSVWVSELYVSYARRRERVWVQEKTRMPSHGADMRALLPLLTCSSHLHRFYHAGQVGRTRRISGPYHHHTSCFRGS